MSSLRRFSIERHKRFALGSRLTFGDGRMIWRIVKKQYEDIKVVSTGETRTDRNMGGVYQLQDHEFKDHGPVIDA